MVWRESSKFLEVLLQVELENYNKIYGAEKEEVLDALSVECSKLKERGTILQTLKSARSIQQAGEFIKRTSSI